MQLEQLLELITSCDVQYPNQDIFRAGAGTQIFLPNIIHAHHEPTYSFPSVTQNSSPCQMSQRKQQTRR